MMFPGQGSQSVGMLAALAAAEPAVAETFGEASDALGYDLYSHGADGEVGGEGVDADIGSWNLQ